MHDSIMIIDDSSIERFIAETIIKKSKFAEKIIAFDSPAGALTYLQSLGSDPSVFPNVILLDIQMPVMNGFGFLDKFLEFPDGIQQHCKVVMFSSSLAVEDQTMMANYPIVRKFLRKPLSEQMFYELDI